MGYCLPVQGSLLADARGLEEGAMLNASAGSLARVKRFFFFQTTTQSHDVIRRPRPVTKSALKPTPRSLVHPTDPGALSVLWVVSVKEELQKKNIENTESFHRVYVNTREQDKYPFNLSRSLLTPASQISFILPACGMWMLLAAS